MNAVLAIGVVPYLISVLFSELFIDDVLAVSRNRDALGLSTLWEIFRNDFWGTPLFDTDAFTHKSYRPLVVSTFAVHHSLWGLTDNARDLRVFNILIYALILRQLYLWLSDFGIKRVEAIVACLWFAWHPVHVECVVYIVGRAELLCGLLVVSALRGYGQRGNCESLGLSLVYLTLAVLCKEQALMCFPVLGLIDLYRYIDSKSRCHLARIFVAALVNVTVLLIRIWYVGGISVDFLKVDAPFKYIQDWLSRKLSFALLHGKYFQLLLAPVYLSWDYSFNAIPDVSVPWDVRLILPLALYTAVASVILVLFSKGWSRIGTIGVSFALLTFFPSSNILFHVGTVIGERLLFLPSVGVALLLALGLTRVSSSQSTVLKRAVRVLVLVVLSWYFIVTSQRVWQWRSADSLYHGDGVHWLSSAKVAHQYGVVYHKQGLIADALFAYDKSIKTLDNNTVTDFCRAAVYIEQADYQTAYSIYQKIMASRGVGVNASNKFLIQGDYGLTILGVNGTDHAALESAVGLLSAGVGGSEQLHHYWNGLGVAFSRLQDFDKATRSFTNAHHVVTEVLKAPIVWPMLNLATMYSHVGKHSEAEAIVGLVVRMEANIEPRNLQVVAAIVKQIQDARRLGNLPYDVMVTHQILYYQRVL